MIESDTKAPCWLVWQAAEDGGRPYLVVICTAEAITERYKRVIYDRARMEGKARPHVIIEPSCLDHLYGESMGQGVDEWRQLMEGCKPCT